MEPRGRAWALNPRPQTLDCLGISQGIWFQGFRFVHLILAIGPGFKANASIQRRALRVRAPQ